MTTRKMEIDDLDKYKVEIFRRREINEQKRVVKERVPADEDHDRNTSQTLNSSMSSGESEYLPSPIRKQLKQLKLTKIQYKV